MIPFVSDLLYELDLLLYPSGVFCELCGERLPGNGRDSELICEDCKKSFVQLERKSYKIKACGRVLNLYCEYVYREPLRHIMLAYKRNKRRYAVIFGEACAEVYRREREPGAPLPELVTGIPSTRKRLYQRGYNPGMCIAKYAARELGLRYAPDILKKVRETPHQLSAGREARLTQQVNSLVAAKPDKVRGKRILLIDDVYTTGSTIAEGARALFAAGAADITVVCSMKAVSYHVASNYMLYRGQRKNRKGI